MNRAQPCWRLTLILVLVLVLGAGGMAAPGAMNDPGFEGQARAAGPPPMQRASQATPAPDVEVFIDGNRLHLPDPVAIDNGRALVPMRHLFEGLDADVSWDAANYVARGSRGGIEVLIPIGSNEPTVNGQVVLIDVPAQLWNGRTYVPLRFVGESLGDHVKWDGANRQIFITTAGGTAPVTPPPQRQLPLVSQEINPAHADPNQVHSISYEDDITVNIHNSALEGPVTVSIYLVPSLPSLPSHLGDPQQLYEVSIQGQTEFRVPVEIVLPLDPGQFSDGFPAQEMVTGVRRGNEQQEWEELPASVDDKEEYVSVWAHQLSQVGYSRVRRRSYVEDDLFRVYFDNTVPGNEACARIVLSGFQDAHAAYTQASPPFRNPHPRIGSWWAGNRVTAFMGDYKRSSYTGFNNIYITTRRLLSTTPDAFSRGRLRHEAAHEYFHAVQHQYQPGPGDPRWVVPGDMRYGGGSGGTRRLSVFSADRWWMESTADYAALRLAQSGRDLHLLDHNYFQVPVYHVYPGRWFSTADDWESGHPYRGFHFIDYLVRYRGIDFPQLWEQVNLGTRTGEGGVMPKLKNYLTAQTGDSWTEIYRDFARWVFISSYTPAGLYEPRDMGSLSQMKLEDSKLEHTFSLRENGTASIWTVEPAQDPEQGGERQLKVSLESTKPAQSTVDIFVLEYGMPITGSGIPEPVAELHTPEEPVTLTLKEDEDLYILATNSEGTPQDIKVSVQSHARVKIRPVSVTPVHWRERQGATIMIDFVAEARPEGNHYFTWDFGDGAGLTDISPEANGTRSRVRHTYNLSQFQQTGGIFDGHVTVEVHLLNQNGEKLANDRQMIQLLID